MSPVNLLPMFPVHTERDNTGLGLVDRQRLKLWLTHACAQMDQVDI